MNIIKNNNKVPKICVPVIEKTEYDIIKYIKEIRKLPFDIIELRADFFINEIEKYNFDNIISISNSIKKIINKPIIFTLRSLKEGGNFIINSKNYKYILDIYSNIIENKSFDLIDLELATLKDYDIKNLIKLSKLNNVKVIISNHDLSKTPTKKSIILRIKKMIKLKCDIAKVAYMPKTKKDVITLLDIANEIKDFPLIAISMGDLGIITRIFCSMITFASVKKSSAPGQLEIIKLKYILDAIYNN